jgi:hypothetical protein
MWCSCVHVCRWQALTVREVRVRELEEQWQGREAAVVHKQQELSRREQEVAAAEKVGAYPQLRGGGVEAGERAAALLF